MNKYKQIIENENENENENKNENGFESKQKISHSVKL